MERKDFKSVNICYLTSRDNYLKVVLPVFFEQKNQIKISNKYLFIPKNTQVYSNKNNTLLNKKKLAHYHLNEKEIIEFSSISSILKNFKKFKITHVIETQGRQSDHIINSLIIPSKKIGIKWCLLGFTGDELMQLENCSSINLEIWDLICPGTNFVKNKFLSYMVKKKFNKNTINNFKKTEVISNPVLSQIKILKSVNHIKDKYFIPRNKKIILVTSLSLFGLRLNNMVINNFLLNAIQIKFLYVIHNFIVKFLKLNVNFKLDKFISSRFIFRLISNFATKNDAIIIYKRRAKDGKIKKWEKDFSDFIIDDQSFYPFTTSELIKISDLYIGFCSFTTLEALAQKTPCINLIATHELMLKFSMLRSYFYNFWIKKRIFISNTSYVFNLLNKSDLKDFKNKIKNNHNFFNFDEKLNHSFLNNYFCFNYLEGPKNFFKNFREKFDL